jgi:formylglycine-generating enzyme required for sulfatase activity
VSRLAFVFAFVFALAGCAPSSQVLFYVDTDATVPPSPGGAYQRTFLYDRLRIDIRQGGAVVETRDFSVDHDLFANLQASIGVALPVGDDSYTARARLYRSGRVRDGELLPTSTLDSEAHLPALDTTGTIALTVHLHVENVGRAIGPDDSALELDPFAPTGSEVGSWPGAVEVACTGFPGPEEVCIPGGAYLRGDPILHDLGLGLDADQEHIVVLKPFYLDLHEVTVGEFRASFPQLFQLGLLAPNANNPADTSSAAAWCTWTDQPGPNEALPVNCLTNNQASTYCYVHRKQLPTVAQLEFVASGRGEERGYVWGSDEPDCSSAIWGRGGIGMHRDSDDTCLPPGTIGGVAADGSALRDRAGLDGGEVVDLAGNLSEYTQDHWQRQTDPFWSMPGVFRDPVVTDDSPTDPHTATAFGGDFYLTPLTLRAAYRQPADENSLYDGVGFRCARPAIP